MLNPILLIGAGYSARVFAACRPSPDIGIIGTTRSPGTVGRLQAADIEPVVFDGVSMTPELAAALASAQALVVSASPEEGAGDPLLSAIGGDLGPLAPRLGFIAYLSTVGVYGDHDGAWIDEEAELRPSSARARRRVAAEQAWTAAGRAQNVPVAILRLSGIYGPGRNGLVNLGEGTARRLVKPGQVFNRIHVDDIAGALWHLIDTRSGGIFNVTDDEPAPPQDVVAFAAGLIGVEPPPEIDFSTATLTPMQRSFYGENKRISNARLKATGYRFRHPDYRQALAAMWRDGTWRGGQTDARSPITSA